MEALRAALKDLTSTSQTRVKAVASAALSNARDYKVVVHEIEKHLWRSDAEKRLAGIYAIDAIVRGYEKIKSDDGNVFAARFALKMPQTIASCKEGSKEAALKKVLDNWVARGLFTEADLEPKLPVGAATPTSSSSAPPVVEAQASDPKGPTPEEAAAPAKSTGAVSSIMALLLQKAKDSGQAPASEPSVVPASSLGAQPSSSHSAPSGPPPLPTPPAQHEVQQHHATSAPFGMPPDSHGRALVPPRMMSMPPGMAPGSSGMGTGGPSGMPPPPGMVGPPSSAARWPGNERGSSSFANQPANYDSSATMEPFRDQRPPLRDQGPPQWHGDGGFIPGGGAPGRSGRDGDSRGGFNAAGPLLRDRRDGNEFRKPRGPDGSEHPLSKTKMCKSIEEGAACRFGQNCAFAHSREELRPFQGNQGSTTPFRSNTGPGSISENGPPGNQRRFGESAVGRLHNGNVGGGLGEGSNNVFYGGGASSDSPRLSQGHSGPEKGAWKRPAPPQEPTGAFQQGAAQLSPPIGTSQEHLPEGLWACPSCGWRNHPQSATCGGGFPSYGCGMPRPPDGAAASIHTPVPFRAPPAVSDLASDSSTIPSRTAMPVPTPSPLAPSLPAPSDKVRAQGISQSGRPSRWSNAVVPPKATEAKPVPGPSAPPGAPPGRGAGRGSASVLPAWMTAGLATSNGPKAADTVAQNNATSNHGPGSHNHANFRPSDRDVPNNANFVDRGSPFSNAHSAIGLSSPQTHGYSNQGLSPGPNQISHQPNAIGVSQGAGAAPVQSAAKKGGSWGAASGKPSGASSEGPSSKRIKLEE